MPCAVIAKLQEVCNFARTADMLSERYWLPDGVGWSDLQRGDDGFLHAAPWLALTLLLLRTFVEGWVAGPLGVLCQVANKSCSTPADQARLWKAYHKNRSPGVVEEVCLAQEIGWTPYRVHRWFWKARNCHKPSTLTKFKEGCWRFLFYFSSVLFGSIVLIQEPFFWNYQKCYEGYPHNPPSTLVLTYWALQLAFYCSLVVSVFRDIRRKDFLEVLLHHVATIALLLVCYAISMVKMGTIIVLVHDTSDVPLELAKLLHYTRREKASQVSFAVFGVVFFITRLIIYPCWLLRSVLVDLPSHTGSFPALRLIMALLLTLQALHIYWFSLITRMAWRLTTTGGEGDCRSESEVSSCTDHEDKKQK